MAAKRKLPVAKVNISELSYDQRIIFVSELDMDEALMYLNIFQTGYYNFICLNLGVLYALKTLYLSR